MKSRRKTLLVQVFALLLVTIVFNTSMMPTGVAASEEENVDSFDVHPANRWEISDVGWDTKEIVNGQFNRTDTGDGTSDSYTIERGLRSFDSKIEARFKVSNSGSGSSSDIFYLGIKGSTVTTQMRLRLHTLGANMVTDLRFHDIDGTDQYKTLSGSEKLVVDTWYVLTIDYNILKSECKFTVKYQNGTRVFRYDYYDIASERPAVFSEKVLSVFSGTVSYTSSNVITSLLDYVKAPYKEREWVQVDTPSDSDWLEDRWDFARVQDDIQDTSVWSLTVPSLDTLSGIFTSGWDNQSAVLDGDDAHAHFTLYSVDADDGDLNTLLGFYFMFQKSGSSCVMALLIVNNTSPVMSYSSTAASFTKLSLSFSMALSDDRDAVSLKIRLYPDVTASTYYDFVAETKVSDVSASPSDEFVMKVYYDADFDGNTEWVTLLEDFGFTDRDIFADIINAIVEPVGNFISAIFTVAFRFLAGIFKVVGDAILSGITTLQTALSSLLTAIYGSLSSIYTVLAGLAVAIGTAVWESIGSALDFITDAIADIAADVWAALEPVIADIVSWLGTVASDVADLIFAVIEFLISLLLTIAIDIFELLAAIAFAVWDALGLPDLLAVLDFMIVGFNGLVTDGLAALQWVVNVGAFWGLGGSMFVGIVIFWLVPVLRSKGDFGEFAESFYMMNSWNIMPFAILGFEVHVPVGVVYWPVFFLFLAAATVV